MHNASKMDNSIKQSMTLIYTCIYDAMCIHLIGETWLTNLIEGANFVGMLST